MNFVDLWGLEENPNPINTEEEQKRIDNAIKTLKESNWEKTVAEFGTSEYWDFVEITKEAEKLAEQGKIKIEKNDIGSYYDNERKNNTGDIIIDPSFSDEKLPGIIIHETTHNKQDDKGELKYYDLPDEVEAYGNQYYVDKALYDKGFLSEKPYLPSPFIIEQHYKNEFDGPPKYIDIKGDSKKCY